MLKAKLLVEGTDDRHVILALCGLYDVPETFNIKDSGGIKTLLKSIPVHLKESELKALGIVLDADKSIENRWTSICAKLKQVGYSELPKEPDEKGTIIRHEGMPDIGIWIMPNNKLSGMLEDFISYLIPDGDPLEVKASSALTEIEAEKLNKYLSTHHQKAFIHTWLAWQETPGQPMGLAITAHALEHDKEIVKVFIAWLNNLFNQ